MFVQVVEQGLTPGMAMGACKLPGSDSSKLSRKITEAVETVARAELVLESTMKSTLNLQKIHIMTKNHARNAVTVAVLHLLLLPLLKQSPQYRCRCLHPPRHKSLPPISCLPLPTYLLFLINLRHLIFKMEGKMAATSAKRLN